VCVCVRERELCFSSSSPLSLFLSLFPFLHTLLQHRLTPRWIKSQSILEFCGSWNKRKSQSILRWTCKAQLRNGSRSTLYGKFKQNHDKKFHDQC
jgi:hypothetical protein